jgi:hypothetical protein
MTSDTVGFPVWPAVSRAIAVVVHSDVFVGVAAAGVAVTAGQVCRDPLDPVGGWVSRPRPRLPVRGC